MTRLSGRCFPTVPGVRAGRVGARPFRSTGPRPLSADPTRVQLGPGDEAPPATGSCYHISFRQLLPYQLPAAATISVPRHTRAGMAINPTVPMRPSLSCRLWPYRRGARRGGVATRSGPPRPAKVRPPASLAGPSREAGGRRRGP